MVVIKVFEVDCKSDFKKYVDNLKQSYTTATEFEPTTTQSSLAKWLSVRLRTKLSWVQIPLLSLKLQIRRLLRARSSLTFRQTMECGFALKLVSCVTITYRQFYTYNLSPIATCCIVTSQDLHWSLHSGREPKDINLSTLRMLLLADRANPCQFISLVTFYSLCRWFFLLGSILSYHLS